MKVGEIIVQLQPETASGSDAQHEFRWKSTSMWYKIIAGDNGMLGRRRIWMGLAACAFGAANGFAQLQQAPADQYIDIMNRLERGIEAKIPQVIEKMRLKPGDIVADIGSGSGTFSVPMAKAIAPNGILYAVDIDPKMLEYVAERAKKEGVTNLRTVLGVDDDPKLPVKDVDVAFFHRVLHMIEHRQMYLNDTAKYMKPDGRIVVIDKNPEQSPNSWMWLKQSDVDTWMAAIAFYPAETFQVFDDRYFVSYQRPYGNSVLLHKHTAQKQ